jgi:uncharacterized membrane protein YbaN (DUF454 family)
VRLLYLSFGSLCFVLGVIGAFVPLLPTTPFMLLAAYCFSRSSEKLHRKLLDSKLFGPCIRDWERGGVISLKTKKVSTVTMLALMSYPLFFNPTLPIWIRCTVAAICCCSLTFIWTRPSEYPAEETVVEEVAIEEGE